MESPDIPYEAIASPAVAPENSEGGSPFINQIRDLGKSLGANVVEEKKEAPKPVEQPAPKPAETKQPESKVEAAKAAKVSVDIPEIKQEVAPVDEVPASIKSTKAAEDWKKLKGERDALKQELEKAKAAPRAEPEYQTRIQQLEAENKTYSEQLRLLDVERHPEFQKKYNSRIEATHELIKVSGGDQGELLSKLLRVPQNDQRDAQIDKILTELPPSKAAKVGALMAEIERIQMDRNKELTESQTRYQSIVETRAKEQEAALAQAKAESERTWANVSASARALEVFQLKDGDEAWNTEVNDRIKLAQQIFNGESTEEDLAKASLWSAAGAKYRELLHAQIEVNNRLTAELAKLKNADAKVSTSSAPKNAVHSSNADGQSSDFTKSFMTAFKGA